MTMDFRALPALVAQTPYDLGRTSKAMVDSYVDTMKENILKDGELTTVAIFRSETQQHVIDCRGLMDSEESKDVLAGLLRKLASEMDAIAFAFAAEAWTAQYDPDQQAQKIMPSEHPNRVECVMISAQYKGDKPVMRVAEIVRDPFGKIKHLLEKDFDHAGETGIEGRFAGILDGAESDPFAGANRWG